MENIIGREMADAIFGFCDEFNKLNLTRKELSLLFPLALTSHGKSTFFSVFFSFKIEFIKIEKFRHLHENFMRALIHEMMLNKRDAIFFAKLCQVCSHL